MGTKNIEKPDIPLPIPLDINHVSAARYLVHAVSAQNNNLGYCCRLRFNG
jgi:hypothetical protein